MGRTLRDSLLIWFGASMAVHMGLVCALGATEVESTSTTRSSPERVVVSLLAAPKPAPAAKELPPVESSPPTPPKASDPVQRPSPKPAAVPAAAPRPVEVPAPPVPSAAETLALSETSAEKVAESDVASSAIATEPSDVDLPIDPVPDYVADVRSRIESKKRYPAMARRRSEEGLVIARLSIASDGELTELEVLGSAALSLHRATREAVENAAPYPVPPRGSIVIEVPLRWRVRN